MPTLLGELVALYHSLVTNEAFESLNARESLRKGQTDVNIIVPRMSYPNGQAVLTNVENKVWRFMKLPDRPLTLS